jgi:hypothetical protein
MERAVVVATQKKVHCVEARLQKEVTHNVNFQNVSNNASKQAKRHGLLFCKMN